MIKFFGIFIDSLTKTYITLGFILFFKKHAGGPAKHIDSFALGCLLLRSIVFFCCSLHHSEAGLNWNWHHLYIRMNLMFFFRSEAKKYTHFVVVGYLCFVPSFVLVCWWKGGGYISEYIFGMMNEKWMECSKWFSWMNFD